MAGPIARLYATLGLDARTFNQDLSTSQRLAAGLGDAATIGATAAGFAIGGFAADGINAYAQLDTKMREVFTLMPGMSQDAKDAMTQDARDFAKEFGISTDEAIGGLYNSLSAGVPQDNVFAFMQTAQKAATAGVTDLTSSVGLLSAVTKGYGDTSQEMTQKVSDLAFTTVRLGQTTFPELSASIGKVVPGASALGVSVEDLNAVFATLTGVTGNTAEVATQWKAVQTALIKPTADMAKALQSQGIESGKVAIETLGLQGTLEMLQDAAGGSDEMLAKMLGSSEALTAVMQLTGGSAEKLTDNIAEMGDVVGATDTAFAEMDSGLEAQGRKIAAFFNDLKLTIGKELQAFGPLFYAFGPQMGRWIGRGFGAAFGFVAAQLPRLMAPLVAKMGAIIGGTNIAGNITSMMVAGFSRQSVMSAIKGVGMSWGKVLALGITAVAIPIIMQLWDQLGQMQDRVRQEARNVDAATSAFLASNPSEAEVKDRLKYLREMYEGVGAGDIGGAQEVALQFGRLGEGNILGSAFDIFAGENPAEVVHDQIRTLEDYIARGGTDIRQAVDGMLDGVTPPELPAPVVDTEGTKAAFAKMRQTIIEGFGSVKSALQNPPQIISREDRIENMEKRMRKVMKNLHKSVDADDPINSKYWTKAAVKQQHQLDQMRGKSKTSAADIKAKFKAMGVSIDDTWLDTRKKAKSATQGAKRDATSAASQTVTEVGAIFGAADFFADGANLITSWANGMLSAIETARAAASVVSGVVAAFFKSASPPKRGPLSTIDKDGERLMGVWAGGIERGVGAARHAAGVAAGAFSPAPMAAMHAGAGGGGAVHIHVGTLIADDKGIDELQRRMSRRGNMRDRKRRRDFETPGGRPGQIGLG